MRRVSNFHIAYPPNCFKILSKRPELPGDLKKSWIPKINFERAPFSWWAALLDAETMRFCQLISSVPLRRLTHLFIFNDRDPGNLPLTLNIVKRTMEQMQDPLLLLSPEFSTAHESEPGAAPGSGSVALRAC
jgi:hypothetical protein